MEINQGQKWPSLLNIFVIPIFSRETKYVYSQLSEVKECNSFRNKQSQRQTIFYLVILHSGPNNTQQNNVVYSNT